LSGTKQHVVWQTLSLNRDRIALLKKVIELLRVVNRAQTRDNRRLIYAHVAHGVTKPIRCFSKHLAQLTAANNSKTF
jgi:hypothetical protein